MSALPLRRTKRKPLVLPPRNVLRSMPLPAPRPAHVKPETLERVAAREDARAAREVRAYNVRLEALLSEVRRLRAEAEALARG